MSSRYARAWIVANELLNLSHGNPTLPALAMTLEKFATDEQRQPQCGVIIESCGTPCDLSPGHGEHHQHLPPCKKPLAP